MSTIFFESGGTASAQLSVSYWLKRLRVPLDAWSRRRRWAVALLILRWCRDLARMAGSSPISVESRRAARRWR